jgi:hypothetical protein
VAAWSPTTFNRRWGSNGDAPVLRILGVRSGDDDLMLGPGHMTVLDPQHLALPAARLECPDDAIVLGRVAILSA